MKQTIAACLFALSCLCTSGRAQIVHNPIVYADRSDPDAIRVGDTYYMTTSSFNLSPGLPIYESTDLLHWSHGAVFAPFQWHANYEPLFGFASHLGFQRIYSHRQAEDEPNLWTVPNLWTQAFPAERFTATAELNIVSKDEANRTGLLVMGWDYCHLALRQRGTQFELVQAVCKDAEQGSAETTTVLTTLPPPGWSPRVTPRTRNVVYGCVSVSMQADSATSPTAPTVKNTLRQASLSRHGKENGWVPASVCVPSLAKGQNADGSTARISHSHHSSETSPSTWRKNAEYLA